ncbi:MULTISPECIES: hypothetical protein [unclassified Stenotrophomonas]|uniref:hypothetical protein n=1 Tax=unclassified Stenotrophomonas TaxID=196198 RepID=UPI0017818339|nr:MULTISPECIES: hypothetical protein [unclassified Stenotrophomonas]UQA23178.1 hypothetical protein M1L61_03020 [Stenotrophomonas sp. NY11291]
MKTPTRTLLASVLLCAPLIASAAPAQLTPEQAFDLYARVLLEDDAAATRTLNDALKPAFEGQDAVTPNPGALAKALAEPWQTVLASAGDKSDAAATEALYAKALRDSKCRATKSVVEDNEYVEDQKLARITYSCQLPYLGKVRPLFAASLASDASPAARKQFTDAYTQALQSGVRVPVSGTFTLYPAKDNGYWYSGNFDDLVGTVAGALAPFEDWMQDAQAASAPKVTGVPGCDLLLQQHRACVAKIAPEQISGVDAMAEELKAKAQVQSAEEMTQECKALRPIAEMMWTDECA